MENRWPSYTRFPATGEEFERYVGTIFEDLGYGVSLTPKSNDYGVDLLMVEPETGKQIVVQAKFFNRPTLNNTPIQEIVAGMSYWNAAEAWVVTNAQKFSDNALNLAQANGVRLFANAELNALVSQVQQRTMMGFPAVINASSIVYAQPKPPVQEIKMRIFNYSDVKNRWGCTDTFLRNQMACGLPLYKQSNGRYSITERELVAWEIAFEEERQRNEERRKRNETIALVVGIALLIVAIGVVIFLFRNSSSMPMIWGE